MLMAVRNTLRFVLMSIKYNLKSALEYKKSFIMQVVFMVINNLFFLVYWILVFDLNNGNINGLELKDVLLLWVFGPGSWGLSNFLFRGIRDLDSLIITGNLDTYLLQPKNMIINIATARTDFGAAGDLIYGVVFAAILSNSILEFFALIFFIIIGAIFFMSCFLVIRCLSIWLGDMTSIAKTYENSMLITLCSYPIDIFGIGIKTLMFTVVPAAYVAHLPIKLLHNFDIKVLGLILIMLALYVFISVKFFYYILKKYESGNNIAMKE